MGIVSYSSTSTSTSTAALSTSTRMTIPPFLQRTKQPVWNGDVPIHGIIFAVRHRYLPFSRLRPVIHLGQNARNVPAAITTTQTARSGRALAV